MSSLWEQMPCLWQTKQNIQCWLYWSPGSSVATTMTSIMPIRRSLTEVDAFDMAVISMVSTFLGLIDGKVMYTRMINAHPHQCTSPHQQYMLCVKWPQTSTFIKQTLRVAHVLRVPNVPQSGTCMLSEKHSNSLGKNIYPWHHAFIWIMGTQDR